MNSEKTIFSFKSRKVLVSMLLTLVVAVTLCTYYFWYNTPDKTLERYLTLVINKQGDQAYDYVYKDDSSYYPELEKFLQSATRTKLIDFKMLGYTPVDDSKTDVKVLLKFEDKIEKEKTFLLKKVSGKWKVVLRGANGNS